MNNTYEPFTDALIEAGSEALMTHVRRARKAQPLMGFVHRSARAYHAIGKQMAANVRHDPENYDVYHFYGHVAFDCAEAYYAMKFGPRN